MKFVKQYGYYRSGTNYTRAVLENNFDCNVLVNHLGCKHDLPIDWFKWLDNPDKEMIDGLENAVRSRQVSVVVTIKDPYSWLDSFIVYWSRRKRPGPMLDEEFMRSRTRTYSLLLRNWKERLPERCSHFAIVRYEDFLRNFTDTLNTLGGELCLTKTLKHITTEWPENIGERIDPHPHLRGRPFDPKYFTERQYVHSMKQYALDIVTQETDWELWNQHGYTAL